MSNMFEKTSPEYAIAQATAVLGVGAPSILVAVPPLISHSPPGEISPVRDIDIGGLTNFFDHSSDCIVASTAAAAVSYAGLLIEHFVPEEKKSIFIGAVGVGSTVGTVAAYEANITVEKPQATQAFELTDTVYGGVTGVLFGLTFCVAAGVQRIKAKRRKTE
jgi:hypothetical protein